MRPPNCIFPLNCRYQPKPWLGKCGPRSGSWRPVPIANDHNLGLTDLTGGADPRIPSMRLGSARVLTRVSLLERSQKIDNFLLLLGAQLIEILDDPVCFAATALVSSDGFNQVVGPTVMEEKDTLSDAP